MYLCNVYYICQGVLCQENCMLITITSHDIQDSQSVSILSNMRCKQFVLEVQTSSNTHSNFNFLKEDLISEHWLVSRQVLDFLHASIFFSPLHASRQVLQKFFHLIKQELEMLYNGRINTRSDIHTISLLLLKRKSV